MSQPVQEGLIVSHGKPASIRDEEVQILHKIRAISITLIVLSIIGLMVAACWGIVALGALPHWGIFSQLNSINHFKAGLLAGKLGACPVASLAVGIVGVVKTSNS